MADVLTYSRSSQSFHAAQYARPDAWLATLEGWPRCADAKMAWTGLQLNGEDIYVERLDSNDILEIEKALADFHGIIHATCKSGTFD